MHEILAYSVKNSVLRIILRKQPLFVLKTLQNAIIICGKIAKLYIYIKAGKKYIRI
jgi:hypothetical protein